MVSNERFLQQLQAGKIGEAFALAMSELLELDVTTSLTNVDESGTLEPENVNNSSQFFRTKINFLTGEVHNEVSHELAMSGDDLKLQKLQKLHISQMNATHQIVQAQFQQIQELFQLWQRSPSPTVDGVKSTIDSTIISTDFLESEPFSLGTEDVDDLLAIDSQPLDFPRITEPEVWIPSSHPHQLSDVLDSQTLSEDRDDNFDVITTVDLADRPTNSESDANSKSTDRIDNLDRELNLYLDRDDEEWEEWVENDDLLQEPVINYSPHHRSSAIPDWEEHWSQQHSVPISAPKTPMTRIPLNRPETDDSLGKFAPEYVGFSATTQTDRSGDLSQPIWLKDLEDINPIEDLLANSDYTSEPNY
jgi:hypothetical protein